MDVQRIGAAPVQPNNAQAQALYALANIQGAVQGADNRVQQAYDETIKRLQEALNQSEANNRLLSEKVAQLNERNIQLEQNSEQLNAARQVKYQAVEERFQFLNKRVLELLDKVSTHPQQALNCQEIKVWLRDLDELPFIRSHSIPASLFNDGFQGGTPSARIEFLIRKIDPDYREKVRASEYNPKIICEGTESTTSSIKAILLDIEAEFKKVLKDTDE